MAKNLEMLDSKILVVLVGITGFSFGLSGPSAQNISDGKEGVRVQKVSFRNRTITVVGNLFRPASFDTSRTYAAIIMVHPHGGVKEQTAGLYARRLAEQGFMTLAYDASYWGESSGEPRNLEVPSTRIEDISCAIDYLSTLPEVDTNNIGVLGICAGGGYALNAAQIDSRIKAVATVSIFDLGDARREGVDKSVTLEQRMQRVQQMAEQRTKEALGIAAAVTIFGLVDAALIRPLPYRDESRLVSAFESSPRDSRSSLSYLDFADWKNLNRVFNSIGAYALNGGFTLTTGAGAEPATGTRVSSGFFRTLGVTPVLGRDFLWDT